MQDLAPNTIKKYMSSFQKWSAWAKSKSCSPIPAPVELFAAFLVLQIKSCNSSSAFDTVIASIAWAHRKMGFSSPSDHPLSKQLINAGHRLLGKNTTNRKKPLLHTHVKALIDKFGRGSLAELQILVLISLGFFGLFRWDELSNMKVQDITFSTDHMAVFVEKRKNDQFREGFWGFIASTNDPYCPVSLTKKFLHLGKQEDSSYIFRKVCHSKRGHCLRVQRLTYSRALELTRNQLLAVGLKPKDYGLHSMRSGGASLAAALGIPDRLIMRHGGWKSETSKNRYISESKTSLLHVSRSLSLGVLSA